MAANPKQLRILDARFEPEGARVLEIECIEGGAFDVVGGKYIIVHTGLMLGDKAVKRAYSLMPVATHRGRARLAIQPLQGPGSKALHEVAVGSVLGFSGPWGKLVGEDGLAPRTLLVATDTGITSALGMVEQSAMDGGPRALEVLWLRDPTVGFLNATKVAARVERADVGLVEANIAPVDSATRYAEAFAWIEARARALQVTHVVATGDGAIVHPLKETLPKRVDGVCDVRIECFFRNPEKKSV